jgi:hypothetical protein
VTWSSLDKSLRVIHAEASKSVNFFGSSFVMNTTLLRESMDVAGKTVFASYSASGLRCHVGGVSA